MDLLLDFVINCELNIVSAFHLEGEKKLIKKQNSKSMKIPQPQNQNPHRTESKFIKMHPESEQNWHFSLLFCKQIRARHR